MNKRNVPGPVLLLALGLWAAGLAGAQPAPYDLCQVDTDILRVRASPDLQAPILDRLKEGDLVQVREVGPQATVDRIPSAWVRVKIRVSGREGWCFGGYLREAPGAELLLNPGFEEPDPALSGLPARWTPERFQPGPVLEWVAGAGRNGTGGVGLAVTGPPNDVRWIQQVPVRPRTDYLLKAWVRTQEVAPSTQPVNAGASVGPMGSGFEFVRSEPAVLGTNGWTPVELRFNSREATELTVALRLGFFSGTTTGRAWFDDVSLKQAP